jgi:hypothetical protein
VSIRDRNIYLKCTSGITLRITADGTAFHPILSPRREYIVFARQSHGVTSALCVARRENKWEVERLAQLPFVLEHRFQREFVNFQPSFDSPDVYVLTDYSSTSFFLVRVNIKTKAVSSVGAASSVSEISRGSDKGNLVILQRTVAPYDDPHGRAVVYVYKLVSPNGRILRVLGEQLADVEKYLGFGPTFWP